MDRSKSVKCVDCCCYFDYEYIKNNPDSRCEKCDIESHRKEKITERQNFRNTKGLMNHGNKKKDSLTVQDTSEVKK